MTFHNLLGADVGRIMLANLHHMVTQAVLPPDLRDSAIKDIYAQLAVLPPGANADDMKAAIGNAIFVEDPLYHCRSHEWPDEDHRFAMVLDFRKVQRLLQQVRLRLEPRLPRLQGVFAAARRSDAKPAAMRDAADVLNTYAVGLGGISITDPNRVLWGTRLEEVDKLISETDADPGLGRSQRARRLRDVLGLVHIDFPPGMLERHLFLFRSEGTLAELRNSPTYYSCARPTALDGFTNPRFCQPHLIPWPRGWGMTIDVTGGACQVGLPEVVMNSLPLERFRCEYMGEVRGASFGPHAAYLALLTQPALDAVAMAANLDSIALAA